MFISKILITTEPTEPTEGLVHPALLIAPVISWNLEFFLEKTYA